MLPDKPPNVAIIVVFPPKGVLTARPFEFAALEIMATEESDEAQETKLLIFCVEPSEKKPVAINCCVVFAPIVEFDGVTVMAVNVAVDTVRLVLSAIIPQVAIIVVLAPPGGKPVANPAVFGTLDIVATFISVELQVTKLVIFWVDASEKIPVAINCCVVSKAMVGFCGDIAREVNVAVVTLKLVAPEIEPNIAVMVVLPPGRIPVASPVEPGVLEMVATDSFEEAQITSVDKS